LGPVEGFILSSVEGFILSSVEGPARGERPSHTGPPLGGHHPTGHRVNPYYLWLS